MTGKEIDELLHKIREKRSKELEGLSIREQVRLTNELADKYVKEHGLVTVREVKRR